MSLIGNDRRDFIKSISKWIAGLGLLGSSGFFVRESNAQSETKMASKDVDYSNLKNQNPKDVNVNSLEITHLNDFGTMGIEDYSPQIADWRFLVDGHVQKDLKITYEELLALDFIRRPVLLVCPGFLLMVRTSLYTILQVLSVSAFERTLLYQLLEKSDDKSEKTETNNQLTLFN